MSRFARAFIFAVSLVPVVTAGCKNQYDLPPVPPPETQPAVAPVDDRARPPICDAPHGGVLLRLDDDQGHVAWDVGGGRLFFLDLTCRPMGGVTDATLYVQRPAGPEQVRLVECPPPVAEGSCLSAAAGAAGANVLTDPDTKGVLRFDLNGRGCRVPLTYRPPATLPVSLPPIVPPATGLPPQS